MYLLERRFMEKFKARLHTFYGYRDLFHELVSKDIKLKYRRSFLGYLWSILNPLLIMCIMVLVFSHMFRFDIENYPVYLIIGQTMFNFFSEATNRSMWAILGNAPLLKKVYVPKYIFTLSTVTSACVNMIFSLGAMVIVFIICHVKPSAWMLMIPIILIQVYIFSLGMGMFLSAAAVFFRDIQYIWTAIMTAWMYVTPIFYPIQQLPVELQRCIKHLNPMYSYIQQFRMIILECTYPDPRLVLYGFVVAFAMVGLGTWFFFKSQDKFILYI